MARIAPIDRELAEGKARELLEELAARGTEPGPMARAMANAPVALNVLTGAFNLVAGIHLPARSAA